MKKKGFTLVELLAVIVILAIIALIATPLILNVIDNAKKGAAEASASGYIDAIEKGILEEELKGNIVDKNKIYNVSEITFVNIKGNKPNDGWVIFIDGEIKAYSLKFDDYVINLEKEKVKTEKGEIKDLTTCMALNIQDDDSYTYGDSYMCNPGDGVYRIFYVLEDGDNTTLVKGDTGLAGIGEISLIMDRNIDNTLIAWSSDGIVSGGPVTVLEHLQLKTSNWKNVSVSLPTGYQIALAGNDLSWGSWTNTNFVISIWLYDYLKGRTHAVQGVLGYWTSTQVGYGSATPDPKKRAWYVHYNGTITDSPVSRDNAFGVRPVITIPKSLID